VAAGIVIDRLRAEAMARRLLRTAARLGADAAGLDLIRRAFEVGMAPRFSKQLDDHHPDYLHPSRTALILMDDARVADPLVLAAALVTETRDASLGPDPAAVLQLGPAANVAATVPQPLGDRPELVEALVGAPAEARLVAVAERLDHARHLHLRDREEWVPYHALTREVYSPIADRTDPALAGRIAWWCTTFEERFLKPDQGAGVARI
jgi:hypothetical protein